MPRRNVTPIYSFGSSTPVAYVAEPWQDEEAESIEAMTVDLRETLNNFLVIRGTT